MMYLESHINVASDKGDGGMERIRQIAKAGKMKITTMDGHDHLPSTKTKEIVLTGHSQTRLDIDHRVREVVKMLKSHGFKVTRYKLEEALVDSRVANVWGLFI